MSFAEASLRRLADDSKGLGEDLLYRLPSLKPLLELNRFGPELIVTQGTDFWLPLVNLIDKGLNPFQLPFVLAPHDLPDQRPDHKMTFSSGFFCNIKKLYNGWDQVSTI
jgi:hypothetical protein